MTQVCTTAVCFTLKFAISAIAMTSHEGFIDDPSGWARSCLLQSYLLPAHDTVMATD